MQTAQIAYSFAPFVNGVVIPILTSAALAAATWAIARVAKLAKVNVTAGQLAMLDTWITNGIAFGQTQLAGKESVTVSQTVDAALNFIEPKIGPLLSGLGLTSVHLAQMITAKLPAA